MPRPSTRKRIPLSDHPTGFLQPLHRPDGLRVIGVVGGVAAGKSLVSSELERLGAVRIDADEIAHRVLDERDVTLALTRQFGAGVTTPEGQIDRTALGRLVFDDSDALQFLECLVHPRIEKRLRAGLEGLDDGAIAVLEAALLIEKHLDAWCDEIIFIETSSEVRNERARRDRGWKPDERSRRERRQASLDAKRTRSTAQIVNDGSREDLRREVERFWRRTIDA